MNILDDLQNRGLVYQVTDGLEERLRQSAPLTVYVGFDPTAESLQIGNLATALLLRRFQQSGHVPIALVGGGTGLIGDPGGRSEERALNPAETVAAWAEKIRAQLEPYLDFNSRTNPAILVNNYDWLGKAGAIDLMRDVGKHFPVPYMLAKDSVASRLEVGISYTEFSYMVLQAFDFLELNERYGCEAQLGGSDQWGNITAGVDLIRRSAGRRAYGLTSPLVTKADGSKFGKTEGNSVWLDGSLTSPYEFYQFWINADDASALNYLKIYTFLGPDEIVALAEATAENPGRREAQRVLAREVTALAHGRAAAGKAEKISTALFYGELGELEEDEIELGFHDVPTWGMSEPELGLVDLLVASGISPSKRQARQDIGSGAIYVNGERCTELDRVMRTRDGLHGKYLVLRRGRSKYFLIR